METPMNRTIHAPPGDASDRHATRDVQMTEVVLHYQARLLARARGILRSEEQAWDVVQEAFIRAWREPRFFAEDFRRGAWLYRVTTNLCFNRARDRRRRDEILANRPPPASTQPPQADHVLDREREAILQRAIQRLSPDHQVILEHRYLRDLTYREISEVLGIKLGTVMSRLARARSALADHLPPTPIPQL